MPSEAGGRVGVGGPVRVGAELVALPSLAFWLLKILTTGMGETSSDFLVQTFPPAAVVPLATVVLAAVLTLQLRSDRYRPALYWTTALLISVVGTMVADVIHVGLGVPYAVSTAAFAVLLAAVFALWWVVERSLAVHQIRTRRRELFYWATVITTFALGTAAGDLTASALHLGYLRSGVLFAAAFAVPAVLWAVTRRWAVALFWCAYVLTRPVGASFADWAAVPPGRGGLGLGAGPVSGALLVVFVVALVVLVQRGRRRSTALASPVWAPPSDAGRPHGASDGRP